MSRRMSSSSSDSSGSESNSDAMDVSANAKREPQPQPPRPRPQGPALKDTSCRRRPSRWKLCNDWKNVRIECDGVTAMYLGVSNNLTDYGLVVADEPIDLSGDGFYFEVAVLDVGVKRQLHVGITRIDLGPGNLAQLGLSKHSFGYYDRSGKLFHNGSSSKFVSKTPASNAVLGFGVNCITGHVFVTKNGRLVGEQDIDPTVHPFRGAPLYPAASMNSEGEAIRVNFGQDSFEFDVDKYFKTCREEKAETVLKTPLKSGQIMPLIREHLNYHAYADTLRSLESCFGDDSDLDKEYPVSHFVQTSKLDVRKDIKGQILKGAPLKALELLQHHFPGLAPRLKFSLEMQEIAEQINNKDVGAALTRAKEYFRETQQGGKAKDRESLVKLVSVAVNPASDYANHVLSSNRRVELADKVNKDILAHHYTDVGRMSFLDTYCERLEACRKSDHRSLFGCDSDSRLGGSIDKVWHQFGL